MTKYCITWGESHIQTVLWANNESEAIAKFVNDMRKECGDENFEPNIKWIDIIK